MIRVIGSKNVRFLYCSPHTFYLGDDMAAMIREAAPVPAHGHVADTFDHKASSDLRYIVNPPGSTARVHQHLDIGQGEVDWDAFTRLSAEWAMRSRLVHECAACGKQHSLLAGTIFEQTKTGLARWFLAIHLVPRHLLVALPESRRPDSRAPRP